MTRLISVVILALMTLANAQPPKESVVLLHGLARTSRSMKAMERALQKDYQVYNIAYPSRRHAIPALAAHIRATVASQVPEHHTVHFVAHSLGGILVRYLHHEDPLPNMGRLVMLSPPNHGSEVVDKLGHWRLFRWLNGPAGTQLGTAHDGFLAQLPSAQMETGIVTGNRSINILLSRLLPGPDDGKVTVASAQLEGMRDFRVYPVSHPFIMKNRRVIGMTHHFLRHGRFE